MNFKDMVNAQIPPPKKPIQQNEIDQQIRVATKETAEYIKTRILSAAKCWAGPQESFVYSSIISLEHIDRWVKKEDFLEGIVSDEVSIKSSGLILKKETETHIVTLNHNGKLFHDSLQNALKGSEITISPWLICNIGYDSDYINYRESGITTVPTRFGRGILYFESNDQKGVEFRIGLQLQYNRPIEFSDVYIIDRFGDKLDRSYWNYEGSLGFTPFNRTSWQRSSMSLCISISYSNR